MSRGVSDVRTSGGNVWDYDSIYGKAQTYFGRAKEHSHSDDDEFVIWHLLGLEFLLRAPLARVHPSLLAAMDGDSILQANGVLTEGDPKSVPAHTVISRLASVVPDFTRDRQVDATVLTNLRNAELHTGDAAVRNVSNDFWLPKLIRVADIIATYLGVSLEDLLGEDVVRLGRALVDEQDKKLQHEVNLRIGQALEFVHRLTETEIASRISDLESRQLGGDIVSCPACANKVQVGRERVRATGRRFEDDALIQDIVYVVTSLNCNVCGLTLSGTAEIGAAGLSQQSTEEEYESLEDLFIGAYVDDDYGNE